MTAIRAHRVGCLPPAARRAPQPQTGVLGPNLPDAACKGRWPLFDDRVHDETVEERNERHKQAVRICRTCPELSACLRARLADDGLGNGVWAGRVFTSGRKCRCGQPIPAEANPQQVHCTQACRYTKRGLDKAVRTGTCETCGEGFTTVVPQRRYCNDTCRRNGTVQPGRSPVRLPGLDRCQECDRPLTQGPGRGRRNCSKRCRRRASERRGRYRTAA